MSIVYEPMDKYEAHVDMARCRAAILGAYHSGQCRFKPRVFDADGIGWCRVHSPDAEAARAAKREERYQAFKPTMDQARRALDERTRLAAWAPRAAALLRDELVWLTGNGVGVFPQGANAHIDRIRALLAGLEGTP